MKTTILRLFLLSPFLLSCYSGKQATTTTSETKETVLFTPGPPAIVYKTTKDYSRYVPVTMNRERTRIVSYPAPSDLYYKGRLALPTRLAEGYLLDNRGIGPNSVFLDYTYEEYVRLKTSPTPGELSKHILDKYPFTAMWDCGTRSQYTNEVEALTRKIKDGFSGCKKIETTAAVGQDPDYGN